MKLYTYASSAILVSLALAADSLLVAQEAGPPTSWTNTAGIAIQGDFLKMEGDAVFIRKAGKEFKIPMAKLSLASREQARKLAAQAPAPGVAPVAGLNIVEPDAAAKSFGKQTDPEHERKLAESILAKKGTVEIWRGSVGMAIAKPEELPKGKLSLKAVVASGTPFSDGDAALLNGCEKLTRLGIHRANLAGLPLESLPALESFEIYQTRIDVAQLSGLRRNKSLKEILCWHLTSPLGGGVIPILAACPNLEHINLHKAGLAGGSLAPLAKLRFVRSLSLGGNDYTDQQLALLAGFPALDNLTLGESNFAVQPLEFLPKLKLVRSLELSTCQLSGSAFGNIARMPSITTLLLYATDVDDAMLRTLSGHKTLRELNLGATKTNGEWIIGLKPMAGLAVLQISGEHFQNGDAVAAAMPAAFPNLTQLIIGAKALGPAGYGSLACMRKLTHLDLQDAVRLDEPSLRAIVEAKSLTVLGLPRSAMTPALVPVLEPLKSRLTSLALDGTRINDRATDTLVKFKALTALSITGTDLSKPGAERLRKALPPCNVQF